MLHVVIQDRDIAHTALDGPARDGNEGSRLLARISNLLPTTAAAAKGEAEQVLNLPLLVARQQHGPCAVELQSQMPKRRCLYEVSIAERRHAGEHQVCLVTCF